MTSKKKNWDDGKRLCEQFIRIKFVCCKRKKIFCHRKAKVSNARTKKCWSIKLQIQRKKKKVKSRFLWKLASRKYQNLTLKKNMQTQKQWWFDGLQHSNKQKYFFPKFIFFFLIYPAKLMLMKTTWKWLQ
jgi:hypothetical protein